MHTHDKMAKGHRGARSWWGKASAARSEVRSELLAALCETSRGT